MDAKQTEKILKALANKRRLAIVKYLHKMRKTSVTAIAKEIKLSFKATSRHLSVLRLADLVEREQVNLMMLYSLQQPLDPILKTILTLL